MTVKRAQWGSRLGFILAAAGSAVGLGAIWKFPYVTANNGGGAFLLLYTVFCLTIGLAVMLAEFAIGRHTKQGPVGAFRKLLGKGWAWPGYMNMLCNFLVMSFYGVIGGWSLAYLFKSMSGSLFTESSRHFQQVYDNFVGNPYEPIFYHALYVALNIIILAGGVQKGIEKLCKYMMPALFILMIVLVVRALTLPGAGEGVIFFLKPNFAAVSFQSVLDALGMAFFSLSLGMGAMITYGSYLPKNTKIFSAALWVVNLQVLCAILAGLMVLPVVFAFNVEPNFGPGLTFVTLPAIFNSLPFGQFIAVMFFTLVFFAALASSISMIEVMATHFIEERHFSRVKAVTWLGIAIILAGIPVSLSFGIWKDFKVLFDKNIFDLLDAATSNLLILLGGISVSVTVGWVKWPILHEQLPSKPLMLAKSLRFTCRWITPIAIGGLLLRSFIN